MAIVMSDVTAAVERLGWIAQNKDSVQIKRER